MAADDIRHCRMPQLGLKRSREDCKLLGMRPRRKHDARRTMISIARAGGATKDLLEWVTHADHGSGRWSLDSDAGRGFGEWPTATGFGTGACSCAG
jgi:hypothetical protein